MQLNNPPKKVFNQAGSLFVLEDQRKSKELEHLPGGLYVLKVSKMGLFLEQIPIFEMPEKMYGNITSRATRIISTFKDRSSGTGVLLNGEKGSGKSLLAKLVAHKCIEENIPVILVNIPIHGDDFNQFVQGIDQPAVLFFDEFEKVYCQQESQNGLLTLLDGSFPSQKLFLMTSNTRNNISALMMNRPGRIFYSIEYRGLETSFIKEYCEDKLNEPKYIPQIEKLSSFTDAFNFDMLKALVEEMNRYNESPMEALSMLNVNLYLTSGVAFDITFTKNGQKPNSESYVSPSSYHGHPIFASQLSLIINEVNPDYDPEAEGSEFFLDIFLMLSQENLINFDPHSGVYKYSLREGSNVYEIIFSREKASSPRTDLISNFIQS